jgi:hypothetical protein
MVLPTIANGQLFANVSGVPAAPDGTAATTWLDTAFCNTVGYLVARTTGGWVCSGSILVNARRLGATGNGTTDDTTAMQAAFAAAASAGSCAYVPAGSYKITTSLTGAVRCLIGDGYQGNGGTAYTVNSTQTTGFVGTAFVCSLTINCIALTTNNAFYLSGFLIQYPAAGAGPGVIGLTLSAAGGSTNVNSGTVIKDVQISGADNSVQLNNIFEFKIDNLKAILSWVSGLTINSPNYKSNGDSTITNSTFWGNGVPGHQYHIESIQAAAHAS